MADPLYRRASRLIVFDSARRILLVRYRDCEGFFWATPGGGLESAEDFEAAARREAHEELGATQIELRELWQNTIQYVSSGRSIHQVERFFHVRTGVFPASFQAKLVEHVREGISDIRWWPLDELLCAPHRVFPTDLLLRLASFQLPAP